MHTVSKSWKIISNQSKLRLKIYLILIFVVSILEVIGISFVIPIIGMMSEDYTNTKMFILEPIFNYFELRNQFQIITFLLVSFLIFILLKNILISFFYYYESHVSENIMVETSKKIFSNYLRSPYQFHLKANSSNLIRNTHNETEVFSSTIKSIILLISESILTISVLIFLLFFETFGTIIVISVFVIFFVLYIFLTKSKVSKYARIRIRFHGKALKIIMEGLLCIKDIKILNKENYFINNLINQLQKKKTAIIWFNLLSNLPRLFLELIIASCVCLLVFFLIKQGNQVSEIFTIIGVFVAAAFRLSPSINKMNLAYQRFLWGSPSVNVLYNQIIVNKNNNELYLSNVKNNQKKNNFKFQREIKLKNVSFNYKQNNNFNIKDINFNIQKGESIGIIGKSGSGKSTILNIILGLLKPKSGSIIIDGIDTKKIDGWNRNVGYVPQNVYLTDDTIFNNVAFGVGNDNLKLEKVKEALKKSQLDKFVSSLPKKDQTIVGEKGVRLSGGQIQRIGIARALYHNPSILVLDEASSALDYITEESLMTSVNLLQGKTTLIIVTHRISTIKNCDKIIEIKNGKINKIKKRNR